MARTFSTTRAARERKVAGKSSPDESGAASWQAQVSSGSKLKAWRTNLVAQLYLTGTMTLADICDYLLEKHGLKVSIGMLSRDLKALKQKWEAQAIENTDTRIRAELAKLDNLEQTAIHSMRDGQVQHGETQDVKGFCDVMLKIAKRRSNLLGLDKAKKLEVTHGIESLSDDELESIAADGGGDAADHSESTETED